MNSEQTDHKQLAEEIFLAGIEAVNPSGLIRNHLKLTEKGLCVNNTLFPFYSLKNIFVIGAGKASGAMAEAVEEILGDRITDGHVIVKYGHSRPLKKIGITEAGHPMPDHNGFEGTKRLVETAEKAGNGDLVLCLISGGGSSLLTDFPGGATGDDVVRMNDLLVKCGASISEINTVRKHLSHIKGGQLARLAYPATMVTLILSDVPGDDPGVIASGPTAPDGTTYSDAMAVIEKYGLRSRFPQSLLSHLEKGMKGEVPENPGAGEMIFEKVHNIIIGNNSAALDAASARASELGFEAVVHENSLFTDVETASGQIIEKALFYRNDDTRRKPVCLLFGGEPTLAVRGGGTGGRNQHLALLCARSLRRYKGITILCGGTDGTDGPTDAAGAVVDCSTWTNAIMNRIDSQAYLDGYDSFNFFREAGGHVITGPTLTNVMDMVIVLI